MLGLFHYHQEREVRRMKFEAQIHGAEIQIDGKSSVRPEENQLQGMQFGDPAEYEKMTPEERQALTDKMMGVHKRVVRTDVVGTEYG